MPPSPNIDTISGIRNAGLTKVGWFRMMSDIGFGATKSAAPRAILRVEGNVLFLGSKAVNGSFRKQGTLIQYPKQQDPYYKDPKTRYPYSEPQKVGT